MNEHHFKSQRGTVIPLIAICLVVVCGMAALAIDLGAVYFGRQRAQQTADAAALAAGPYLNYQNSTTFSSTAADAAASSFATANSNLHTLAFNPGASGSTALTSYPTSGTYDDPSQTWGPVNKGTVIEVSGYVNVPMTFAGVIGYNPTAFNSGPAHYLSVPAHATVALISASTITAGPVMPVGVVSPSAPVSLSGLSGASLSLAYALNAIYYMMNPSQAPSSWTWNPKAYQAIELPLKAGSWSDSLLGDVGSSGNFGYLNLPGDNGTSGLRNAIEGDSNGPVTIGGTLSTKPGNSNGASGAWDTRFGDSSYSPTNTDLSESGLNGTTTGVYDQWFNAGEPQGDARLVEVPITSLPDKSGSANVTVIGFLGVFLEGMSGSSETWTTTDPASKTAYTWNVGSGTVVGRIANVLITSGSGAPPSSSSGSTSVSLGYQLIK